MVGVGRQRFLSNACTYFRPEREYPEGTLVCPVPKWGYRVRRLSSNSFFGATYGRLRKSWSKRTGPTIRMTSGVCVPETSALVLERAGCCEALVPLVWANAPEPTSATKTPNRQSMEAVKTRRLKKAD